MSLSKRSLKIIGIGGAAVLIISIVALSIGRSNQTTSPPLLETSQQVSKNQDNIVTLDDGLRFELPANSIFEESDTLTIASYENPPHGDQGSIEFIGRFYDIDLHSGEFFNGIGALEIPYDESSIPQGYSEDEVFAVYSTEGEWYRLYGDVNSEENTITVYTIHNGFWSTAIDKVSNFIGDVADFFSGRTSDYSDIEAARENVRIKRTEFLQTFEAFKSAVDSEPVGVSDIKEWAIKNLVETAVIHGLETPVVAYAGKTVLAGKIVAAGATIGTWVGLAGGTLYVMAMAEDTGEIMALRIRLEIALDRLQEAEAILWALEHPEALTLSPDHQKALEDHIAALPIDQTISTTTPIDFTVSAHPYPTEGDEYSLTVSGTGGGSVTTPGEGTFIYDNGNVVSLVASPISGYRFVNWAGDVDTVANVNAASTTVTMNDDYAIIANFEEVEVVQFASTTVIAAGGGQTVGLKSDGIVVAAGANYHGQSDVSDWTNIIQVAAGDWHTVGLKSDGTVVAVGYNDDGRCNVDGWTGIIQVDAGEHHTVGLKSDGTVVVVGYDEYGECNIGGWMNIIQVAAGELHTVGLKSDGTVIAVGYKGNGECDVGGWTNIIQVDAGSYFTVGLKSDGTAVGTGLKSLQEPVTACDVDGWTDIIQLAAGDGHTVGLKEDGTVVAVGYNLYGESNVGDWTNIIQVAAGELLTVGLKSDGTVIAVGINRNGACDIGGWDLS